MKNYFKIGACLGLFIVLLAVSCQKEEHDTFTNPGAALNNTSALTVLLKDVARATATDHHVLDSASCFRIKLPVEVTVNGHFVLVQNEEGYQQVADYLNQSNTDSDDLSFGYPITAVYDNGEEIAVNSQVDLNFLRQTCPLPPENAPIGCAALAYPFSIALYDPNFQNQQIVTINSGLELLTFLGNLTVGQIYQINYPIIVLEDSVGQEINSNDALMTYLNNAVENCGCSNPNILTEDLVTYIPFGNEIKDLAFQSDIQEPQSSHFVTDRSGNPSGALSFDESSELNRLIVGMTDGNVMNANGKFTISLWFNRQIDQQINEQMYVISQLGIYLGNQSNNEIKSPFVTAFGLIDPVYDLSWIQSQMMGEIGVWHHIVVTYDANATSGDISELRLYRDGILRNTAEGIQFQGQMGGGVFGGFYKGYMDDIRIYKRTLNSDEVQTLFNLEGDINQCMN